MSFSGVTERGSATERNSDTTHAVSPSAALTVGKHVILYAVTDNTATVAGASTDHASVTDTDGHTWTKLFERTQTNGAAGTGVTHSAWLTKVTSEISTSDVVTLTIGTARVAKVLMVLEFSAGAGSTVQVANDGTPIAHDEGSDGEHSCATSGMTSQEYLHLGFLARENETVTWTEDADYTNVFAAEGITSGPAGGANTNVTGNIGYRIATLTGDTFTQSFSGVHAAATLVALEEVAGGTNYNEQGRNLDVASTLDGTSQLDANDDATLSVASSLSLTDQADYNEAAELAIASTLSQVDSFSFTENLTISGSVALTESDRGDYNDDATLSVASSLDATDQADLNDDVTLSIASTLDATDALSGLDWSKIFVPPTSSSGLDTGDHTSVDEPPPWNDSDEAVETVASSATEVATFSGFDLSQAGGEDKSYYIWWRGRVTGTFETTITVKQAGVTLSTIGPIDVTHTTSKMLVIPIPDADMAGEGNDDISLEFSNENMGSNATVRWTWLRISKTPFTTAQEADLPADLAGQEFILYRASDLGVLGAANGETVLFLFDASGGGKHTILRSGTPTYDVAVEGIYTTNSRMAGALGIDVATSAIKLWDGNLIFHTLITPDSSAADAAVFSIADVDDFLGVTSPGQKHLLAVDPDGWTMMSGDGSAPAHLVGDLVVDDVPIRITEWVQVASGNEHMWENDDATPTVDASSGDNPFGSWSLLNRESNDRPLIGWLHEQYFIEATGVTEASIDGARDEWVNGPSGTNYDETGRELTVASTLTASDQADMNDAAEVAGTATLTASDRADLNDDAVLSVASTLTAADVLSLAEGLELAIASTLTEASLLSMTEAALLDVVATLTETDVTGALEEHVILTAVTTLTATDVASFADAATLQVAATLDALAGLHATEGVTLPIVAGVTAVDLLKLVEGLLLSPVVTLEGTDTFTAGSAGYDETDRQLDVASTLTAADFLSGAENVNLTIVATLTGTDVGEVVTFNPQVIHGGFNDELESGEVTGGFSAQVLAGRF